MGAGHVKSAFGAWAGRLPSTSFIVLVFMANTARDDNREPTWYGGREQLCAALGRLSTAREN